MDLAGALGLGAASDVRQLSEEKVSDVRQPSEDPELVAFVGAGGKKTAMARLVAEGVERGVPVGYTTTTHTPPPNLPLVVADIGDLPGAFVGRDPPVAFASGWVTNPERADRKLVGYDPDEVSAAHARWPFAWTLVKADGARRRGFKAPGAGEPAVPAASTHVVPVASTRVIDEPLDSNTVHRPERVAELAGVGVGERIAPETVGRVLAHPDGGLKNAPADATITPLLNQADTPELRERAREALGAALARSERLTGGLITSFETGTLDEM